MQKISLLILASLLMTTVFVHATVEDTESTLDYIENTSSGVYKIHGKNISDPTLVNLYIDNKKVDISDIAFTKDGMTVKNFSPLSGTFMIERMKADYGSGNVAKYISDKKTESIKTRKTDILGFNGQIIRDTRSSNDIITLPFIDKTRTENPNQLGIKSQKKIFINGQEKIVIPYAGEYLENIYYSTAQGITFIEKNLTERINTIELMIDGLSSNFISIIKGGIILDSPSNMEIEDIGVKKDIKIYFSIPRDFTSTNNKEILVNGTKIDNSQATIGLGNFIIRYDISKLPKEQNTLSIVLKDLTTNKYSNEQIIDISEYSAPKITSINTGEGGGRNFTFNIKGNGITFFGDLYKLQININGINYTREGTKEVIKNGSGVIQKDSEGLDKYEIKYKIELRKTGEGLEFDAPYSILKDFGNTLYIQNDNTGRESNVVSFNKTGVSSHNYNYLTGASLVEDQKQELIAFEIGKDFERKVNATSMTLADKVITLGKIKLANLKNNEYYILGFIMDSNISIQPFTKVALDGMNLETIKNGEFFSFIYKKQGLGKDLKTDTELIAIINELYNISDKPFILNIQEITLKKLRKGDTSETMASIRNPIKAHIFYSYTNDICFDGTKDFCSLVGIADPLLRLSYSGKTELPDMTTEIQSNIPTSSTNNSIPRKNISSSIVTQDFSNEKFKKAQGILSRKYEALKRKQSIHAPKFRKAVNDFLVGLKNIELKIQVTENIKQLKDILKTMNEILRQAK